MKDHGTFLKQFFQGLVEAEQEALARLGDKKGRLFIDIVNEAVAVNGAIVREYRAEELDNLVFLAAQGVFKEARWLHLFFVSGHYGLLKSRLRFIWEWVFRAFWAESKNPPARCEPGAAEGQPTRRALAFTASMYCGNVIVLATSQSRWASPPRMRLQ
jgi:hypothetical protein